jgi:N-ethylmaleimide reductase
VIELFWTQGLEITSVGPNFKSQFPAEPLMPSLHSPIQFGEISAPNRIFMAPLTRCRADADHVPTDVMAEYYAQRVSGGLLIAEATMVMEGNSSFWMEPGIYSAAQVAG